MDIDKDRLIAAAREAREGAYAPYSGYAVGAALLAGSGKVYAGANVENAVFPLSMCAERVAAFMAVAAGERDFVAIAVATDDAGTPCGSCRQVLSEFNPDALVIVAGNDDQHREWRVRDLLPHAFGPENLEK